MNKSIKARVLVAFTDREDFTNVYQIGDTFQGTQARVDELAAGGYVEPIASKKNAEPKES